MMTELERACRSFNSNRMKPGMYNTIFDAIAKDKGVNINKQVFEISERDLKEWVNNKIMEYDNADNKISD